MAALGMTPDYTKFIDSCYSLTPGRNRVQIAIDCAIDK